MERISTLEKQRVLGAEELSGMIDAYEKLVFSICYKLTGDYFSAEDLTQETFLTAYQKYQSFDGQNEKAWICRIATNKSIDYLRSAGRRSVPTESSFFETEIEKRGSPEEICMEEEIKRDLRACCDSLKPPYDEVAEAYYCQGQTASQIAQSKGKKLKTIQTQIGRAKKMLQKLYRKEELLMPKGGKSI